MKPFMRPNMIVVALLIAGGLAILAVTLVRLLPTGRPKSAAPSAASPAPLVPPEEIISGGPARDGIPPIDLPKFTTSGEAEAFVRPNTLGILVTVGSTSRFYPYNILTWHEIVNDEIEGRPLTVTFCPLCATGFVFERRVATKDGRELLLDFGTSGKLYQSNLVMYDRQTESLWSQILMKAVIGPLTGTELALYPASVTEFSKARQAFPNLQVLSTDTGHVRDYRFNPYQGYEESDAVWFPVSNVDRRLPPKELTYALSINGVFKAYRWSDLLKIRTLKDSLSGHELEIRLTETDEPVVDDLTAKQRVIGFHVFWFSVSATHPDIELWTAP